MRTVLASFMFILGSISVASAQESETESQAEIIILGLHTVEADDNVVGTLSRALRVVASNREGLEVDLRDVTLAQMVLAHPDICPEPVPDLACMTGIAASLFPDRAGSVLFGMMRRVQPGSDEVYIDLALYEMSIGRVSRRVRTTERLSDLIIGGHLDATMNRWLDRLLLDDAAYEDTGQPYFDPIDAAPSGSSRVDHTAFEIAGWSLVGLAVVSAVAAIASGGLLLGANDDTRYNAYRASWDASVVSDVCQVASSDMTSEGLYAAGVCSDASLFEILVPVFWTVAAAAGVAGTLLAWHPWSLQPTLSQTSAGLDLRVAF